MGVTCQRLLLVTCKHLIRSFSRSVLCQVMLGCYVLIPVRDVLTLSIQSDCGHPRGPTPARTPITWYRGGDRGGGVGAAGTQHARCAPEHITGPT